MLPSGTHARTIRYGWLPSWGAWLRHDEDAIWKVDKTKTPILVEPQLDTASTGYGLTGYSLN